jgi:hypothetical protein
VNVQTETPLLVLDSHIPVVVETAAVQVASTFAVMSVIVMLVPCVALAGTFTEVTARSA